MCVYTHVCVYLCVWGGYFYRKAQSLKINSILIFIIIKYLRFYFHYDHIRYSIISQNMWNIYEQHAQNVTEM